MNITQILFDQVQRRPEALAIRHSSGDLSYAEFGSRVLGAAEALLEQGVAAQEVIGIRLDDPLDHWQASLALAHVGAIVLSLPRSMPTAQRERLMTLTGCTKVIEGNEYLRSSLSPDLTTLHWSAIRSQKHSRLKTKAISNPDWPWIYVSGSGSTGRPKIMPITHRQELARTQAAMQCLPYTRDDIVHLAVGMQFSHSKRRSLEASCIGAAISLGAPGELDPTQDIKNCRITVIHCMAFHAEILLKKPLRSAKSEYSNLRALILSGSTVSKSLRNRIKEYITENLYIRWGANEIGTSTTTRYGEAFGIAGSVGHAFPGIKIEVVDDDGQPLPANTDGLIRVKSSTMIDGYLGDPEATKKAFRNGWFYPGDIGHLTNDGQLIHRGRADDMMIVSGVNIYPAEIEECLKDIDGVADALATPLRHHLLQHLPVALVVPRTGASLDKQTLIQHVHNQIGNHTLHDLVFVESIPRNDQGKIQRDQVNLILQSAWGSQRIATINPMHGQPQKDYSPQSLETLTINFLLPHDFHPQALHAWITTLDEELLKKLDHRFTDNSLGQGRQWLEQILALTRGFLHLLRIPIFEPIAILECISANNQSRQWKALIEHSCPSLVPTKVMAEIVNATFRITDLIYGASPDSGKNKELFFEAIENQVLKKFSFIKPQGKSTFEIIRVAHDLNIPYRHLASGIYQLGWGSNGRRIDRSTTDSDSAIGRHCTDNKFVTAQLLREGGLPAPIHGKANTLNQAREIAERLGYPVVIKPADLERGEGVTVDIGPQELETAYNNAYKLSPRKLIVVEKQAPGICHRLFIVAGQLLYAVKRLPIGIYADGHSPIKELIERECMLQQQVPPWRRSGIQPLDEIALKMLVTQGLRPTSVPKSGQFVALRRIETTAWGGVDEEVTDSVHPDNLSAAITATQLLGLEVAGVDIISSDISQPWHTNGAIINEVNYAPLLGGGEISRRYIKTYLNLIINNNGHIPIYIYAGEQVAHKKSVEHWKLLCDSKISAYWVNERQAFDAQGKSIAMRDTDLNNRLEALLLRKDLQILIATTNALHSLKSNLHKRADIIHLPGNTSG